MIRLLHVIGTSEVGGTERFLIRLVEALDRSRFTSDICVLEGPGALAPAYRAVAGSVEHLGATAARTVPTLLAWRKLLAAHRPDVLVLYGSRANLLGRLVSRGTPVVAALRSVFVDERGTAAAAWLDRLTFRRVDVCISNSYAALHELLRRGYPAARLAYIPNGIDRVAFSGLDRFTARQKYGIANSTPVVACVANLKPVKAHDVLLEASARLKRDGLAHQVWLLGDGPERPRLEAQARNLGLEDSVRFLGTDHDVPSRLAAADVFVLASRWEGMPTAVLEAMAAGLPVVATRVGEIPAIVEDGAFGSLVPADDAERLGAAVGALLRDPERRRTWGDRARRAAEQFSMTQVTRQYEAVFQWAARRGAASDLHEFVHVMTQPRKVG